ncbi:myocardin related transcription factor Ab isoform X3 [Genypterus blacodes]|uniref:myocardin related transcription factor Ab isoform X3 n=1 Tax=Genypterus blacodes TaxID=154954 RepID=UPI003F768BF6
MVSFFDLQVLKWKQNLFPRSRKCSSHTHTHTHTDHRAAHRATAPTCEVLQLKLQQRRTREELVSQGIMPPLKSPAAFHEQRRSLERARTEDYLKRKIRSRPERSELVRMHILEETSAEPSLQAKQLQLKRARLADDLNDKISHRPGPIELVHKNILSVDLTVDLQDDMLDSPKGAGGESSSLDEDSSDALSPDQLTNHDSPLSAVPQLSPSDLLSQSGDMSPTQFLPQPTPPPPPPPPPPTLQMNGPASSPPLKLTNGNALTSRHPALHTKSQSKMSSDRPSQRPKKPKDNKPKVKKLKYHQYIPPDQKADKERPPQMDSSYAKLLHQQQLFLQLQILNQQQQHYNYHTILPAPPKPPAEQPPSTTAGPSPSRSIPTATSPSAGSQGGSVRQSQAAVGGAKPPSALPANLDEFKVAELKQELKLRGLTVSGTKNDLIERLRNYQEQNGGSALKNGSSQPGQQGAATSAAGAAITSPARTGIPDLQSGEGGFKISLCSLGQGAVPGRVMRFGSTSSSPPVSPTPSERSLAAMSPDETSCNGDMFGEMVSSPLTQLTLHPSPQHPSSVSPRSQSLSAVKEETRSSCGLSRPPLASGRTAEQVSGVAMDTAARDKDQMLHEKDKQIEELTRMLKQKQRLVETLRSQLEQGKMGGGAEKEGGERIRTVPEVKLQTLIKASAIQPPRLPNGMLLKVKKEAESEEGMEGVMEAAQNKKPAQPMQCSQETLVRLQQIQRLQSQQAEQQKQQQQKLQQNKMNSQKQQKAEVQVLLQQQQQLQQLIIQQTQQKQLQAQQKLAQQKLSQQSQGPVQTQQKNQAQMKPVQVQNLALATSRPAVSQAQQRKQLKAQQRQQRQQAAAVTTQQATPVLINQPSSTQVPAQTISLDLLKANGTPTLVTDGNGNHYLIALTSNTAEGQNGVAPVGKLNGRITLQRLQSTPSKLPSTDNQSKEQLQPQPASQPIKKGQKAGLHVDTNGVPQPGVALTAPPNMRPFFDDVTDSESQSSVVTSLKDNGLNCQQMDDLFDILLKSGGNTHTHTHTHTALLPLLFWFDSFLLLCRSEISGFKSDPDPSLAPLHSDPPSPSSPPSPLHLSPPTPPETPSLAAHVGGPCGGGGRLEDFLESSTGSLLGVEADGGLSLMDDLHSQMLSTPSILDHPPSPMDTSDLGFSPHSAGLDFGDPTLDSMDWLDISMGGSSGAGGRGGGGRGGGGDGGTSLAPLAPHTPPSVFSADFLDSSDLQLHWESCL